MVGLETAPSQTTSFKTAVQISAVIKVSSLEGAFLNHRQLCVVMCECWHTLFRLSKLYIFKLRRLLWAFLGRSGSILFLT